MKVCCLPDHLEHSVNYSNYNREVENRREQEHREKVAAYLRSIGYTGKNTGKIVRFGVADGYAVYMLAEGKTSCLIHLEYGDAYEYPDVKFLPKAEIMRRIAQAEKFEKAWKSRA